MEVYTQYYSSPLGWLQLKSTNEAITSVYFFDQVGNEETDSTPVLEDCIQQLDEYFAGKRRSFHLAINQQGTEFQQKIWHFLSGIPYGKTISYLQLAKQYGDIKAIRAVASANGKNHLPIIVPCHRVIGSNTQLTGYSGGLWRKQWLLQHEAKFYTGVQQFEFG